MDINKAIDILYNNNWLYNTILNKSKNRVSEEEAHDVTQDLALRVLTSTTVQNTIQNSIKDENELKYYFIQAINLELFSKTSYYNYHYGKYNERKVDIDLTNLKEHE